MLEVKKANDSFREFDSYNFFSKCRLPLEDEKITQQSLATIMEASGVNFKREHRLDKKNIIDFYLPDCLTGVEIKIGNVSRREIYKQVTRYASFDEICNIILLTNKMLGFPEFINNKRVLVINLGRAWI